jgi:hypothetical protein
MRRTSGCGPATTRPADDRESAQQVGDRALEVSLPTDNGRVRCGQKIRVDSRGCQRRARRSEFRAAVTSQEATHLRTPRGSSRLVAGLVMAVAAGRLLDIRRRLSSRLMMVATAVRPVNGGRFGGRGRRHAHRLAHGGQRRPAREQHDQQDAVYPP